MNNSAILDKTGLKVKCCRHDCGAEIADIEEVSNIPDLGGACLRVVRFPLGWAYGKEPGGTVNIWHETSRSRDRERHGKAPGLRLPPRPNATFTPTAPFSFDLTQSTDRRRGPAAYPVLARCRRCKTLQWLDADRLNVVADQGQPDPIRRELLAIEKQLKRLAVEGVRGTAAAYEETRRANRRPGAKPSRHIQAGAERMAAEEEPSSDGAG